MWQVLLHHNFLEVFYNGNLYKIKYNYSLNIIYILLKLIIYIILYYNYYNNIMILIL